MKREKPQPAWLGLRGDEGMVDGRRVTRCRVDITICPKSDTVNHSKVTQIRPNLWRRTYGTDMVTAGRLLQKARQINTGMTQAEAAKAAGFRSHTWLAQIEAGIRVAPPDTLARMARVVQVTPTQLRKIGEDAAADELEELLDLFGPYVSDSGDLELLARIKALDEEQRKALFVLLKVLPSAVPVALVSALHRRPGKRATAAGLAAALTAGAATAVGVADFGSGERQGALPAVSRPASPPSAGPGAPGKWPPGERPPPGVGRPRQGAAAAGSVDRRTAVPGVIGPGRRGQGVSNPAGRDVGHSVLPVDAGRPGLPKDPPVKVHRGRCLVAVSVRPVAEVCLRLPS